MIKILKGEGKGKTKEGKREKRMINAASQSPFANSLRSPRFLLAETTERMEMGILYREASSRAEHLKPGHYNHTVSGDLALSLDKNFKCNSSMVYGKSQNKRDRGVGFGAKHRQVLDGKEQQSFITNY